MLVKLPLSPVSGPAAVMHVQHQVFSSPVGMDRHTKVSSEECLDYERHGLCQKNSTLSLSLVPT